jgi:hypothetical protein
MMAQLPDHEALLEIGRAVSGVLLLGGLGVLALGRVAGDRRRARHHTAPPPPRGSVPAYRHQNFAANPAR